VARLRAAGVAADEADLDAFPSLRALFAARAPRAAPMVAAPAAAFARRLIAVPRVNDAFATLAAHLHDVETEACGTGAGARAVQRIRFGAGVQGHPGVVHGGIVSLALDDALGVACSLSEVAEGAAVDELRRTGATASLRVAFARPCAVDARVEIEAHLERAERRKRYVRAVMRDAATGAELASAEALYVVPRREGGGAEP
jgi:acyl-coenzyme A thioesterase PaaI-like protein